MKVLEAVRLVRADYLALRELWAICLQAERVQIALILGRPAELPARAATPELAWQALNLAQRRLVLAHAPQAVRARLPDDPAERRCVTRQSPHLLPGARRTRAVSPAATRALPDIPALCKPDLQGSP